MLLISHRGNINKKLVHNENKPEYILEAKSKGFDVEIDVWFYKNKFYLGHDEPQYDVNKEFLMDKKFWCHAKNHIALSELSKINCHYFWHNTDDYTITSKGYIWIYPGKPIIRNGICVMPENSDYSDLNCLGICSDEIENYRK